MTANLAASIRARLLNLAKERGEDFSLTLNRYAIERYLYRLAQSPWRDKFLLKGALLFDLWLGEPHRPTRDADLQAYLHHWLDRAPPAKGSLRLTVDVDPYSFM